MRPLRSATPFPRAGRVAGAVVASLLVALLLPSVAQAQLRIIPRAGLWSPQADLPRAGDAVEVGERESTLAYGADVELGTPGGTTFRVGALHGTNSDFPVSGVGCGGCEARTSVTAVTATVVFRPLDLVVVRPYLLLGGGLRRIDFDREDLEAETFDALYSDQNDVTGRVGVGVELALPLLHLDVELTDLVSPLSSAIDESELQHDLFLTVGIVIG